MVNKQTKMLSIRTQAAIAVLHDISSGNNLQSGNFLFSEEEWKILLEELEKRQLICLLPDQMAGVLFSYKLCCPLADISLLDVLQALNEPIRCTMPTPEEFYMCHSQIAHKVGVLNQVTRTFLSEIKIADW